MDHIEDWELLEKVAMSPEWQAKRLAIFQERQPVMDLILELHNAGKLSKNNKKSLIGFLVDLVSE